MLDVDAVKQTTKDAVAAARAMDYEPSHGFKTLWPDMWCEWASIAIAEALRASELGEWTFVQASRSDELNGHAWLELRDDDGTVLYSIDATLHQFKHHDSPFTGPGETPAKSEFTNVRFEGQWRDWHVITHTPKFIEFADATLRELGLNPAP